MEKYFKLVNLSSASAIQKRLRRLQTFFCLNKETIPIPYISGKHILKQTEVKIKSFILPGNGNTPMKFRCPKRCRSLRAR